MTETEFKLTRGAELRARRLMLGLSQDELAEGINVAKASVSRWETGEAAMSDFHASQLRGFFRARGVGGKVTPVIGGTR